MNEELLIRFLTHRCAPAELTQVDAWVSAEKANAEWLFEMERIWSLKNELKFSDKQEIEAAYTCFCERITQQQKRERNRKRVLVYGKNIAAACLLFGILSAGYFFLQKHKSTVQHTSIAETPAGSSMSLTLSDGTVVYLNARSILTYPETFCGKTREVTLTGEAFFEVFPDSNTPFIVRTSHLQVTVLGTRFNLKAYDKETSYITLSSGGVAVQANNKNETVVLMPNQQVAFSNETGLGAPIEINAELVCSWMQGEFCFINLPLSEITNALERHFNVHITISDRNLAADRFSCRLEKNITIIQALDFLKETQKLNYTTHGKAILITPY